MATFCDSSKRERGDLFGNGSGFHWDCFGICAENPEQVSNNAGGIQEGRSSHNRPGAGEDHTTTKIKTGREGSSNPRTLHTFYV